MQLQSSGNGIGKRGFTLIELLVVILIISLLAGILFPVFARARENARRAGCMSNLQQISLAVMQYTQDYDERYPPNAFGEAGNNRPTVKIAAGAPTPGGYFEVWAPRGHYYTWMDSIYSYTKSIQVFVCPSYQATDFPDNPSYGYNVAIGNWHTNRRYFCGTLTCGNGTDHVPLTLAQIQRPSEIYMILDFQDGYSWQADPWRWKTLINSDRGWTTAPHLDGGNVAFADGHVKWITGAHMRAVSGDGSASKCNPDHMTAAMKKYSTCSRNWNPYLE